MIRPRRWHIAPCFALLALLLVWGCNGGNKKPDEVTTTPVVVNKESGATILITADTDPTKNPSPRECALSKGNQPDVDHVRWYNQSGHDITLTFKEWPFLEKQEPIVIKDGAYSAYFTLDKSLPAGAYTYEGNPPLPSGGPGEPAIVDGP